MRIFKSNHQPMLFVADDKSGFYIIQYHDGLCVQPSIYTATDGESFVANGIYREIPCDIEKPLKPANATVVSPLQLT